MNAFRILALLGALVGLSGCVALAAGGAAAGGVAIAQEKSVGSAVDDTVIQAEINHYYLQSDIDNIFTKVEVRVEEGRVLLTGKVPTENAALEAVRLAWKANGVREVINELRVTDQSSTRDYAKDAWISTQIKSKLLFEKNVRSVNYSIETVNQEVFLFGIAQNQEELDKVLYIARTVKGVTKVVNHVRLKDDPRRPNPAAAAPASSTPAPVQPAPAAPAAPAASAPYSGGPVDSIDAR